MEPVTTIEEAQRVIEAYKGNAEDFELPISDELQDPVGINMAIITDGILAKGWEPNGYVQKAIRFITTKGSRSLDERRI